MSGFAEELRAVVREVLLQELPRVVAELRAQAAETHHDRLLDVDEAAKHLGLSRSTVYKRAQICELPSVKMGTRLLFRPADLDAYAEARQRGPERVRALAAEAGKR